MNTRTIARTIALGAFLLGLGVAFVTHNPQQAAVKTNRVQLSELQCNSLQGKSVFQVDQLNGQRYFDVGGEDLNFVAQAAQVTGATLQNRGIVTEKCSGGKIQAIQLEAPEIVDLK